MSEVRAIVVMGVSGCGKTSVGAALARELGGQFEDADDLHPRANVEKMSKGIPLDDEDRWPWLALVSERLRAAGFEESPIVIACSALRRVYRDRLREGSGEVFFLHLDGAPSVIHERMKAREGHFMPTSLLESQIATLEPLAPDEDGVALDLAQNVDEIIKAALVSLAARAEKTPA